MNIKIIPGILQTSSNIILGVSKKGVPKKKFIPYDKDINPFAVPTKKPRQSYDIFVIVKVKYDIKHPHIQYYNYIGPVGDYKAETIYLKYIYNIKWKKVNQSIDVNIDLTPNRIDFTHLPTISIDPYGCKDIDDALSFERINNNIVKVGVHIADVSSFIPACSKLDLELQKRGESIYLFNEQIDMIPNITELSLLANKVRRTYSAVYTFENNVLIDYYFVKGLIKNDRVLSYREADKLRNSDMIIKELFSLGQNLYKDLKKKWM